MLRGFTFSRISSIRWKHYITAPMFYVNGEPHIGHLYSALLSDANHRWTLLKQNKSADQFNQFIVGTDEHGIKVQTAAKNSGRTPKEHCDFYADRFRLLFDEFNISYTKNIRTTDPEHEVAVKEIWNRLNSKGYIYKSTYEGWYSMVDERFYTEEEIEQRNMNGEEMMVAKESLSKVEWIQEDNYMFRLEKFKDAIHQWLTTQDPISPASQLPHILQSLKNQTDLSISRDSSRLQWGIRVPNDDSQTLYVWLDALCSYLTATGFPDDPNWRSLWPADIHFIGKDIRTFHAIFWPAFLLAAELPLPKKIYVHSHWLVDGRKMSKSVGNVVNPFLIKDLLTVDGLRYFLLKQSTQHNDANFTILKAIKTVNTDLVNNLGNLLQRSTASTLNQKQRYPSFDVEVMEHELRDTGEKMVLQLKTLRDRVTDNYDKMMFYKGLELIAEAGNNANVFFQLHKPWLMKGAELQTVLYLIYETSRICNLLLQPIVPHYADRSLKRLGIKDNERSLDTAVLGGGPTMDLYGRPMGPDLKVMERIDYKAINL